MNLVVVMYMRGESSIESCDRLANHDEYKQGGDLLLRLIPNSPEILTHMNSFVPCTIFGSSA